MKRKETPTDRERKRETEIEKNQRQIDNKSVKKREINKPTT